MAADFPLNFQGCRVQSAGGGCGVVRVEEVEVEEEEEEGREGGQEAGWAQGGQALKSAHIHRKSDNQP